MKKISLMILILLVVQIIFPIFTVLQNNIFTITSYAQTSYSTVDLDTLEEIKDNSELLSQVHNINVISQNSDENEKIKRQLELIKLCTNVEYIYIYAHGLTLDKSFFNNISSSNDISISLNSANMNIDFKGIKNSKITKLWLSGQKTYNFSDISNLTNLNWLSITSIDGLEINNLKELKNLEYFLMVGQRIDNYQELFSKVSNIKVLSLEDCNFQNTDTTYMNQLTNLEELNLFNTYVTDISFLRNLPKLKLLTLPFNVDDLSVLYELNSLESINFEAITETKIDENLIKYFNENNISYPADFDTEISSKLQKIVDDFNFSTNTSDEEKIRKVTEYVVKSMRYSPEYIEKSMTSLDKSINYGIGVCHGYSILEYTLLTMVGIETYRVVGFVYEPLDNKFNDAHAWNMVRIGEDWYAIDPTWCDSDLPDYKENIDMYFAPHFLIKMNKGIQDDKKNYFVERHVTYNNPQDTFGNKATETRYPDVNKNDWFYNAVEYVSSLGMMNGYTAGEDSGKFGPENNITRGQIVTILYRRENNPDVSEIDMTFNDVGPYYYYDAIKWAAKNKIVTGHTAGENAGKFMPDDPITREQLAVILQRYANYKGKADSETISLESFKDYLDVSPWALDGLKWIVSKGIITGDLSTTPPSINPQGNATRAQAATMIMRFCENIK